MSLHDDLLRMARLVQKDEARIGVYSTGEVIAVALILNRPDLLPPRYSKILEAVDRLGEEWFQVAIQVQREL
jgi:hypothetical protein